MADNATPIEKLIERTEDYTKTTFELFKMQAISQSADVVSSLVTRFAIILAFALSVFILTIGISLWLGVRMGNIYYGFFVTGGFYIFIAMLLLIFRKYWIKTPVSNSLINQMLNKKAA